MYNEILELWKRETTNKELQRVENDFYSKLQEYITKLKTASSQEKTITHTLQDLETKNAIYLVRKILDIRFEKIIINLGSNTEIPDENIFKEEKKILKNLDNSLKELSSIKENLIQVPKTNEKQKSKTDRTMIRFLKDMPKIIGTDMKHYGPFKSEDISCLSEENVQTLIKRGLAVKIDFT